VIDLGNAPRGILLRIIGGTVTAQPGPHIDAIPGESESNQSRSTNQRSFQISPPVVSLPQGGGSIRGIGEKFAANPITGSATFSIPLPASPGRAGFGPQLSLNYDSGSGNGIFGFGWTMGLPSISRKTEKGLPRYVDVNDTFLISGAEDLVPVLDQSGRIDDDRNSVSGFVIRRFRPRIEGLFARIERWTGKDGDVHWRSISPDNILSIYGKDETARIADPLDKRRIFSWLISETRDDKGNAIVYEYIAEDGGNVDVSQAHESNRAIEDRTANRYIKRILYGNRKSLLNGSTHRRPRDLSATQLSTANWMFEMVFDYGEHPGFDSVGVETWQCRPDVVGTGKKLVRTDPFSSYRAGFEIRTYRLCQRVFMLHNFQQDPAVGQDCLVRSLDFAYRTAPSDASFSDPGFAFLEKAAQRSYQRDPRDATQYLYRTLPPLEFTYSEPRVDDRLRDLGASSLRNLPVGLGNGYQWIDLDGDGLSGIFTEQAAEWYYKPNLGMGPAGPSLDEMREVVPRPSIAALDATGQQLLDIDGSGKVALVELHSQLAGFHQQDDLLGWMGFVPFRSLPNIDWDDPDLRFIDLTGDGRADALITECEVFTWYPSEGTEGFGSAERCGIPLDETMGPRVVFADEEQQIYLADMSGDGLTDIVRIRRGQIAFWPNCGYGHFGKQVIMDASPLFDEEYQFDQRRIRLADVDGSGTADLIYMGRDGARLWLNRSGNEWSNPREISFPVVSGSVDQIKVVDLFGSGTACLVWSSDMLIDARRPMKYLDLMGYGKPYLMTGMVNNLGSKIEVKYSPSTKYYIQDRLAGTPWATKLPFPVQCVEEVTVCDLRRKTRFSTTYSYHHGYFDGAVEREFRGFGRVEQVDTQRFEDVANLNAASPYVTPDLKLFQPPVKTITWYHTGIAADRNRILGLFEHEYFPMRFGGRFDDQFAECELPQPKIDDGGERLKTDDWCEAMRACKGKILRQEIYEIDLDALYQRNQSQFVRLFSVTQNNYSIQPIQRCGINKHGVYLVTQSEALSYDYELVLDGDAKLTPDPRIVHTLNLRFDDFGRIRQSVSVAYPRIRPYDNPPTELVPLTAEQLALIRAVQNEIHMAYTETVYTNEIQPGDDYRLPPVCETRTYELTGFTPPAASSGYFTWEGLRKFGFNPELDTQATSAVVSREYEERQLAGQPCERLVEHTVTLYLSDDLAGPLPRGASGRLGLVYENYKLALTDSLLTEILANGPGQDSFVTEAQTALAQPGTDVGFFASGYQRGAALFGTRGIGQWWIRSGIAGFVASAAKHFYLPENYLDPFGNETSLAYDGDDLFITSSTDPVGNQISVTRFDYRALSPSRLQDLNENVSAVALDVLGMPVAMAQMGKVTPGPPEMSETKDTVDGFSFWDLNPDPNDIAGFFTSPTFNFDQARKRLGKATARYLYHFGESVDAQGNVVWGATTASACSILRESHQSDLANTPRNAIPIQVALEYSDGAGQTFVKKIQAEPDPADLQQNTRWIANGKTIVNNKGNSVLQYEPYFSSTHLFKEPQPVGVSPIMYFDAPGRLVRTEFPDGSFSRVEFSPWIGNTYDQNDTVLEPGNRWYTEHTAAGAEAYEKRAARLTALHADTPSETHFDSLGRAVIAIARNRGPDQTAAPAEATSVADWPWKEERYLTFTKIDTAGKPLWVCDARGNLVMQFIVPPRADHTPLYDSTNRDYRPAYFMPGQATSCYDIAGNLLFQHSMDAGDRRMLMDAAGQPLLAWDYNERKDAATTQVFLEHRRFRVLYDDLHRPTERWLRVRDESTGATSESLIERFRYGEQAPNNKGLNLRGQAWQHYDSSGLVQIDAIDLLGKPLAVRRRLASDVKTPVLDWQGAVLNNIHVTVASAFDQDIFTQRTEYDALGRITLHYNWHVETPNNSGQSDRVAVYFPTYNKRGLLDGEKLLVRAQKTLTGYRVRQGITLQQQAVARIDFDAKGQKLRCDYGNGTVTLYDYDPETFRLRELRTTRPGYNPRFPSGRGQLSDPRVLQHLYYTYDPSGNITDIEDDAWTPAYFRNQQIESASSYVYDATYRLIEATGREDGSVAGTLPQMPATIGISSFPINASGALRKYTQRYIYDAVGNMGTMRHIADSTGGWTREYSYANSSNQLLGTDTDNPFRSIGYDYDTHGSMLNLNRAPDAFDLRWDWNDMIRTINLGGGGRAWYQYGADKQRCRKRIERQYNSASYWERIYLQGFELYRRYDGLSNAPVEQIESHHLFDGEQRLLLVDDVVIPSSPINPRPDGLNVKGQTLFRYQYSNHLGSACLELDDHTQIISYEEYHPYGTTAYQAVKSVIEAPPKRYRYTGMETDEESQLGYHSARYYVSWLGRWASPDDWESADPGSLCAYARGNPVRFRDTSGRFSEAGHFYLTYLIALSAGYEPDRAFKVAFFSQLPDEARALNAQPAAREQLAEPTGTNRERGRTVQFGLHALTGGDPTFERQFRLRLVKDLQNDDFQLGLAIHALGDAFSHELPVGFDKMAETPYGHKLFPELDQLQYRPSVTVDYGLTLYDALESGSHGKPRLGREELRDLLERVSSIREPNEGREALQQTFIKNTIATRFDVTIPQYEPGDNEVDSKANVLFGTTEWEKSAKQLSAQLDMLDERTRLVLTGSTNASTEATVRGWVAWGEHLAVEWTGDYQRALEIERVTP
jgi:RHS repeat-associated protein